MWLNMSPENDKSAAIQEVIRHDIHFAGSQLAEAVERIQQSDRGAAVHLLSAAFFLRSAANALDEAAFKLQQDESE
jgi:hypothetical protein